MKSLKDLQRVWYKKLADSGFKDIEETHIPDRPLKDWHSFHFAKDQVMNEMNSHQPYQERIEAFYNHDEFAMVCKMLSARRNALSVKQIRRVWELHIEGRPLRAIAKEMGLTLNRVAYLIGRLRAWMNLTL